MSERTLEPTPTPVYHPYGYGYLFPPLDGPPRMVEYRAYLKNRNDMPLLRWVSNSQLVFFISHADIEWPDPNHLRWTIEEHDPPRAAETDDETLCSALLLAAASRDMELLSATAALMRKAAERITKLNEEKDDRRYPDD